MSISLLSPLSSNLTSLFDTEAVSSSSSASAVTGGFSDILSEALNNAESTDTADKASTIELLTGQSDDMSGLLLDSSKAEIALSLTIQLRNRVVDAYNEIMRMSV